MTDSWWYYGVVAVAALEVLGFGIVGLQTVVDLPLAAGLVGVVLFFTAVFLLPVYGACLFFDARAVRESSESWDPNPYLWAGGGTLLQVVALGAGSTLYTVIAVIYLWRRFDSSPAAVADEDAWADQAAEWDDDP